MTDNERKEMMILADTINGEINRMCVTKELAEFDTMYGHAKKNLDMLSKMIYDARFKVKPESETWEGIHAQVTAPKGTFDKIWNEAEDNDEI